MSSKQDLAAARTPGDIERKYNFGKTFAEVFGMAEDAQKAAEKAQQAADTATEAVGDLDQDAIFNLLTNNGEIKGLFMKDGQLYINASYLVSGVIKSENGKLVIDLSGETVPIFNTGISTNGLNIRADEANAQNLVNIAAVQTETGLWSASGNFYSTNGKPLVSVTETFSASMTEPVGVSMRFQNQDRSRSATFSAGSGICGFAVLSDGVSVGSLQALMDGTSQLTINKINGKTVSWKDNGDGTFTLVGQ